MLPHTEIILSSAKQDKELAVEIFCELYIYNHYTEDEVGSDSKSTNYCYNNPNSNNSWLNNLMYRLSSIFRRRGISISLDIEDVSDLIRNKNELGISV